MRFYKDMLADHQRLIKLAQATLHDVHHSYPLPATLLEPLARCLSAHIRNEEEIIFVAVEQLCGDPDLALTASLRQEHAAMSDHLATMEKALHKGDRAAVREALLELLSLLRQHCEKEEAELYALLWPSPERGVGANLSRE